MYEIFHFPIQTAILHSIHSTVSFSSQDVHCGPGRIEDVKILENKQATVKLNNMNTLFTVTQPIQIEAVKMAFDINYRVIFYVDKECFYPQVNDVEIIKDEEKIL